MGAFGEALAIQAGSEIASGLSEQLSYGIGEITGYNDAIKKDALEQYEKTANIQAEIQKKQYNYQLEQTSPAANMKRLKEAGLNPALMYGMSGAGGSTGTMGSVAGGNTPSSAQIKANNQAAQGYAMQLAKLQSEIDVNKSVAKVNEANANKATAETKTSDTVRHMLYKNLEQDFKNKYMQNSITEFKALFDANDKDSNYRSWDSDFGDFWIEKNSTTKAEIANAVLKTYNEAITSKQLGEAATKNAKTNELAV